MNKYKIGDAVMASVWKKVRNKLIHKTIKTIIIEHDCDRSLIYWDEGVRQGRDMNFSWFILDNSNYHEISDNPWSGQILGKICPNTLPKCIQEKFKDVISQV